MNKTPEFYWERLLKHGYHIGKYNSKFATFCKEYESDPEAEAVFTALETYNKKAARLCNVSDSYMLHAVNKFTRKWDKFVDADDAEISTETSIYALTKDNRINLQCKRSGIFTVGDFICVYKSGEYGSELSKNSINILTNLVKEKGFRL